jgi:ribulose-phosphate 3-epimerase
MVLVMSVEPGFGGQAFMPSALPKIRALKGEIRRRGLETRIEIDGGVTADNASVCAEAGADVLVAGSAIFGAPGGPEAAIPALRRAASHVG